MREVDLDFRNARKLYHSYLRALCDQRVVPFNADLAGEVETRLEQLDFVLMRILELDRERIAFIDRENPDDPSDGRVLRSNAFEIRLLTEAFYYFASRLRTVLRHKEEPCPLLEGFECAGVRVVRNTLLEHPEGQDSRVFGWSWTVGSPEGPILKVHRENHQVDVFPDRGLYVNAQEVKENLERELQRALAPLGAEPRVAADRGWSCSRTGR